MLLLGTKIGMTRVLQESGQRVPVTVIKLGPCVVTQVRTAEKDGYSAVQIGFGDMKARNSTIPVIGHDAKAGAEPKRHHREFKIKADEAANFELGKELTVKELEGQLYVDVIGTSKGKGFAGVMKRWHFKGMFASHGTERKHRSPGSIASRATWRGQSGKPKKGVRMAGHMGMDSVTTRNHPLVKIDAANNLLLIKGALPGPNGSLLFVRKSVTARVREEEAK